MKLKKPARRAARKISYANVVATMALFIALGGISWAAATAPKNSVASKSIKKNAVTNAKIKNNAVTSRKIKSNSVLSSDVKNDALTGTDINESTLGKVPNAAVADGSANQLLANVRVNASSSNADQSIARANATEIPLGKHGTLEIYGKCFRSGAPLITRNEMYIRTTQDGAAFYGYGVEDSAYDNPPLNTSTLETDRQLAIDSANNSTSYEYAEGAIATDPNGATIQFHGWTWVRDDGAVGAPAFFTSENACTFHLDGTKQ